MEKPRHIKNKRIGTFIAMLICIALVMSSPGQSYTAYADGDDDDVFEVGFDDDGDEPEEPVPEPEPEPVAPTTSKNDQLQTQINNISKELAELEKQREGILQDISSVKGQKEQAQAKQGYVSQQMQITESEIYLLQDRISALEEDIEVKLEEIDEKQADYDEKFALFQERVRAMYMYDNSTTIGLVLGTDSFVDFLTTTDMLTRVADHDKNLMAELEAERLQLEADKKELEESKASAEADMKEVEEKKQELSVQQQAISAMVEDISELERQYNSDLAANKQKANAMEAEIKNIYAQIQLNDNPYVGGEMQWPVPNFYQITSYYGWRFGGSDYHTGVDISGGGVYGANVVAANDGVVKHVNWSHTPGRGYGIYVIIDHGGKISTLYGHLSNISVSVGQEVSRGQVIGNVGSTGWSTGPHLHFEVRNGTQHLNPMGYLKG